MNAMTVAYVIDVSLPTSPCFCHLYNHHSFKLILILAHFYYSTNNYSTNFVHFKRANSYVLTIKILETPQPPKSPTKPFSTKRCLPQCLPRQIFHSIFAILHRGRRRDHIERHDNYTFNRSFVGIQFRLDEMQGCSLIWSPSARSCVLLASFHLQWARVSEHISTILA